MIQAKNNLLINAVEISAVIHLSPKFPAFIKRLIKAHRKELAREFDYFCFPEEVIVTAAEVFTDEILKDSRSKPGCWGFFNPDHHYATLVNYSNAILSLKNFKSLKKVLKKLFWDCYRKAQKDDNYPTIYSAFN